jgi:hypothetical protein
MGMGFPKTARLELMTPAAFSAVGSHGDPP